MGRKPDPTNLKVLRGNPGRRRLNENEPNPPAVVPAVPKELKVSLFVPDEPGQKDKGWKAPESGKEAAREFKRLSEELHAMELITTVDVGMLSAYCQAYGLWKTATAYVNRYGPLIQTKDGNLIQSPYVAIVNKQAALMAKLGSEFGLSPASRTGLEVPKKGSGDDFSAFLGRKKG